MFNPCNISHLSIEVYTYHNSKLRQENDELRDRLNSMALALSDLNRKVEDTENERLSLVTTLKILHEEQANDLKDHSRADGWQKILKRTKRDIKCNFERGY